LIGYQVGHKRHHTANFVKTVGHILLRGVEFFLFICNFREIRIRFTDGTDASVNLNHAFGHGVGHHVQFFD